MIGAASGLAIAWPALAAPPASLDLAPEDTPITITVRDIGALIDKLDGAAGAIGLEGQARMAPQMMNMMVSMPGLNRNGSMTVLVYPPEGDRGEPGVMVIAPVSDYGEFAGVMGGDASAEITTLNMQGNEVSARDLGGGYALLSDRADLVGAFSAENGRLGAHTRRLGAVGGRIADVADVTIIADIPTLAPMLRAGMDAGRAQAAGQAQMLGDAGAGMLELAERGQEAVLRDASVGVLGLSVTEVGLALDVGLQFKDGSESGAYFAHEGTSDQLIERLPMVDYYMAWAIDSSSPKLRELGERVKAATAVDAGGEQEPTVGMAHLVDNTTGIAGVVGANPGLMMTGIMANTVIYARTDKPEELVREFERTLEAADGSTVGGVSYNTEFDERVKEIAGVPVCAYAINMDVQLPDDAGAGFGPDPQMINQAMFGAAGSGPRGYVAATKHGMVHTFSRSETFVTKALESAEGGAGLTGDEMFQRVAPLMPKGRTFEGYLALDQIGKTVAPFMLMMGVADQVPTFDPMPPVALGVTTDSGGVGARLIVPNEVIRTVYGLAPIAQQMGAGMGGLLAE